MTKSASKHSLAHAMHTAIVHAMHLTERDTRKASRILEMKHSDLLRMLDDFGILRPQTKERFASGGEQPVFDKARVRDFYRTERVALRRSYYAFLRATGGTPNEGDAIESRVRALLAQHLPEGEPPALTLLRKQMERVELFARMAGA